MASEMNSSDRNELPRRNSDLLVRAWSDAGFRERLRREPEAVLAEYEIPVPAGAEVVVLEDTPTRAHVVIPAAETFARRDEPAGKAASPVERVIAAAATDAAMRRKLEEAPSETLRAAGVSLPPDLEISVVRETADRTFVVLPSPPDEGEVSDEDLISASGGVGPIVVTAVTVVTSMAGSMAASAVVSAVVATVNNVRRS